MKALARITGTIFIIVGLLVFLLGIFELVRGITRPEPFMPGLFGSAEAEGMLLPLRLIVGWIMSLQGLMMAALGEGLWLVSSITENTRISSERLGQLLDQGKMTIP